MINIEYRVEKKYLVSDFDLTVLAQRLSAVAKPDVHQTGTCYEIRSIYFDDIQDSCLNENESGIDCRKKYRIRTYGTADSPIKLEIKEKYRSMTKKRSCTLSTSEYHAIMDRSMPLQFGDRIPLNQLTLQMRCAGMKPKVIITYERTAFVHPVGNVRITFDRNIAASREYSDLLNPNVSALIPILPAGMHILEVKYDEFLPDIIAKQLEIGNLSQTSFSKYYLGRLAVNGIFPIQK